MQGLFVTATDTGVGKSVLSACLIAAMRAEGLAVAAYKPVLTGTAEPPDGPWPSDDALLALVSGEDPSRVAPLRFAPAVSPHLAAQMAEAQIDPETLVARARLRAGEAGDALVVEGVGGLLVPLAGAWLVRDLAAALGLPVVIAARPGLGTINHTLLTLQSARAAGLDVRAVVLTPWGDTASEMERSNRETIAELGAIDVRVLPAVDVPMVELLAEAGATLPWRAWLGASAA